MNMHDTLRTPYPEVRDASGKVITPAEVRGADGRVVPAPPGQGPASSKSLGRMNELGTLFATIAGMLNLIVIIDATLHTKQPRGRVPGSGGRPWLVNEISGAASVRYATSSRSRGRCSSWPPRS